MARKYQLMFDNAPNYTTSHTTIITMVSAATVKPMIYDLMIGSRATPADQAATYGLQRFTAAGTAGASYVARALDPGNPTAIATSGITWAAATEPTWTADYKLLVFSLNQRATFRWVAAPGSELIAPATAANGLGLLGLGCTLASPGFNVDGTILFEE